MNLTAQTPVPLDERISRYLDKCPPAISGQGGHAQTFFVACQLVNGFGLDEHAALAWLARYSEKCVPPWTQKELEHKIKSAAKASHSKQRGHLLSGTLNRADYTPPKPAAKPHIVATYPYTDENGKLLFECVRYEPKTFRQRQPDGAGGWKWNLQGVATVLFRLPEIRKAIAEGVAVFITEGEKDALALVAKGIEATCNPMGAGKWRDTFSDTLAGADCVIIPDNDETGRKHAAEVAASLHGKAASVRLVTLPEVLNGRRVKDAADYFSAGATDGDLLGLCEAAPEWQPQDTELETVTSSPAPQPVEDVAAWIRGVIVEHLTAKMHGWEQRQKIAAQVVEALAKLGRFYYHAEQRDFESALYFNAQTKRLERIASDSFAAWLSDLVKVNRGEGLFRNIFTEVQNAALTSTHTTPILPAAFWDSKPGAIYLSNGDGHLVKITAESYTLADNGTDGVLFPVGATLAPWRIVEPRDPFTSCTLFRSVHAIAPHGKLLLQLWAYSIPTNPRSKPPALFTGDIGSGKTRTAKGIAELYGLPFIAAKVEESGEDDFWPAMDAGGLFCLDNVDTKNKWVADAIANAATDGCKSRRRLYTNAERVVLRARAWLAVTSANPTFANDAGLADRLLVVRMGRHEGETSDNALTDEILANRDAGMTHLASVLSSALADNEPTPAGLNARHPDFAAFAVRIGRAMFAEDEAIAALKAAEQDKSVFCLENDGVATALLNYLDGAKSFEGTGAELLPHLHEADPDLRDRLTVRGLGKRLAALLPHLAKVLTTAKRKPIRGGFQFTFRAESAGLHV